MGNYWVAQRVENEKLFLSSFEQRLKDMYLQELNGQISLSSSGRLFKHIKNYFRFEKYLDLSVTRAYRIAISKIKLSSHNFSIERGRWGRVPRLDRKCTECNEIEDEYHCLIECPRYANERKWCLPVSLKQKSSMFGLIQFIKSEDYENINKLGRLCYRILKEHRKCI